MYMSHFGRICTLVNVTTMKLQECQKKFCQVQRVRSMPLSICNELSHWPTIMFHPPGDGTDLLSVPHWLDHSEE